MPDFRVNSRLKSPLAIELGQVPIGFDGIVPKPGKFGFSSLTLGSVLPGSS